MTCGGPRELEGRTDCTCRVMVGVSVGVGMMVGVRVGVLTLTTHCSGP